MEFALVRGSPQRFDCVLSNSSLVRGAIPPKLRNCSILFAGTRRSSKQSARPDGKLLILNNPLDQSELVDCGLSMRPITAVESPFMLQNVGTYQ